MDLSEQSSAPIAYNWNAEAKEVAEGRRFQCANENALLISEVEQNRSGSHPVNKR